MCWLTSRWKPIQHQPVCCPRPDTFNPFLKHEPPQSPSIQVSVRGKNHMLLSLRHKLVQFSLCGKFHCGLVPEHSPCLSSIMGTFLGCYFAQNLPSLQQIIWEDKKFHLKKNIWLCVFSTGENDGWKDYWQLNKDESFLLRVYGFLSPVSYGALEAVSQNSVWAEK